MNIFYFTEYKIPKSCLQLENEMSEKVLQINIENEDDLSLIIGENKDHEFVSKLKDVKPSDKSIYLSLLAIYLYGGVSLNSKIILKNMSSIEALCKENEVVVVKSCLYDEQDLTTTTSFSLHIAKHCFRFFNPILKRNRVNQLAICFSLKLLHHVILKS